WSDKVDRLTRYLGQTERVMSLFDVPLHYHLYEAARMGRYYDLRTIFQDTLVAADPWRAVTFVDNHDTQLTQMLPSWVQEWFKLHAYALILLREQGFPCVFYGDLYGIPKELPGREIKPVKKLERLLQIRQKYAHGEQKDYFNHPNRIAWTRGSGMVVVLSNTNVEVSDSGNLQRVDDGEWIPFGKPGQVFVDLLGNRLEEVVVGDNGWAKFLVATSSVSVWVPKE
ncbi:MAG: alpha-amylase, partial [Oscillospiraceae bacterium]|nr:alpha-amylase [Oscillospiraceae bacterium]